MRTIYYGKNYRVFLDNDIGRTEVTTDLFDGMPEEVIDCYYYIPAGVTWRDSDGNEHTGECIVPSKDLARFASMSKTVYAELDKPRQQGRSYGPETYHDGGAGGKVGADRDD